MGRDWDDFGDHDYGFDPKPMIFMILTACVLVALFVWCCVRRRRQRNGRVLAPPPPPPGAAAYPQQQYAVAVHPHNYTAPVTTYPVQSSYPAMPQPTSSPYPSGAPYPPSGAPYPPGGTSYAMPVPYPTAPTAPDANALPPTYDQATGQKQAPYNPNFV